VIVAPLDQIEIGRRNAKRLGHGRLRQGPLIANAPDARPGKNLAFAQLRPPKPTMMSFTTHDKIAAKSGFDNLYKFTECLRQTSDSLTSIFGRFCCFFWLIIQCECKFSHRKSSD
jgi:hypothetical protein